MRRPRALQRDRPPTAFSSILSDFVEVHEGVAAAVFVDAEGECIDYATQLDPYEALVFGATLLEPTTRLAQSCLALGSGSAILWVLEAQAFDAVVRRISEEHLLALRLDPGKVSARLLRSLAPLSDILRREAGLRAPEWDPEGEPLEVEIREAKGWGYAPSRLRGSGDVMSDLVVLGRWTERSCLAAEEAVCFRVRVSDEEFTLVHERWLNRWYRRKGR